MSTVVTVNPATGERPAEYPAFSDAAERAAVLRRAAEVLRAEVEDLARLVTREMGKPLEEVT